MDCSALLILDDSTQRFMIHDDSDFTEMFSMIYQAAQSTGITYDALKHVSIMGTSTITKRVRTTGQLTSEMSLFHDVEPQVQIVL